MTLNYDIAVDLTPEFNRQLSPKFSVSLGDHGAREYTVQILQDGEPFVIEEGSAVSIVGKKSDGHIFAYACTYFDSFVRFTIEEQMTPVSGIVTCELSIIDASGNKVGSANFTYWVEPSPVTDGEASESDLQLFQQILDAADDLDDVREILDRAVPIAEQLGDVEKLLTAFPTEEASGSLLTLTDGADGIPAKKVTLNLSPHQSGSSDPSPENVRPISGYTAVKVTRAGKNLANVPETTLVMGTNRTISLHVEPELPPGTYTLSVTVTANTATQVFAASVRNSNAGGTNIALVTWAAGATGRKSVTFTSTVPVDRFYAYLASTETDGASVTFADVQIEAGSAMTDYEPYVTPDTYAFAFPTAAGTVYGGTLAVDQDGSGTLTVDRAIATYDGSENWLWSTATNRPNIRLANGAYIKPVVSNMYPYSAAAVATEGTITTNGGGGYNIWITDSVNAPNLEAWKTFLASHNLVVVYYIATPQTYTLTAEQVTTLLGDNTVWMDADGSIDLTYRADTQKYIDSRIALLNSNLAYIEDGMTASRAYSVGQYVLIGGQLYKVTASIASGATFTIGTNVVATTVGEELTALN